MVGHGLTLPPLIRKLGLVSQHEQDPVLTAEARRRLTNLALTRMDDLAAETGTPDDVTQRLRTGYEVPPDHVERRLDALGPPGDGGDDPPPDSHDGGVMRSALDAEMALRRRIIAVERNELDRLVARRKVTRRVAEEVHAAPDVAEPTMRP